MLCRQRGEEKNWEKIWRTLALRFLDSKVVLIRTTKLGHINVLCLKSSVVKGCQTERVRRFGQVPFATVYGVEVTFYKGSGSVTWNFNGKRGSLADSARYRDSAAVGFGDLLADHES